VLFLICKHPLWTSNVIRMISLDPAAGRNGLVNQALVGAGSSTSRSNGCCSPIRGDLAFVHLYTLS